MKHKIEIIAFAFLAITSFSCKGTAKRGSSDPIITVTIEPQRFFVEAIAGDRFTVRSMVPRGVSPETYDPTPRQLVDLSGSEAYFRIGHIGFELSWMQRLQENAPHLKVFDLSKGIDLIRGEGHSHGDHHHEGGVDPHLWNSSVNARIIARNTLKALVALDPEGEALYTSRFDSLLIRIDRTDSIIRHTLQDGASHAFMIYHPALSYFAREYGLLQICIEDEGKEPSPAHLKELIETAKAEQVNVIFVQPEFDKRNAEVIAQQIHARIVPVNPLEYDWEGEMVRIARGLKPQDNEQ